MEIIKRPTLSTVLSLLAGCALTATQAQGQTYSVKDIGTITDLDVTAPLAMNQAGQIVGTHGKGDEARAFRYDDLGAIGGTMQEIAGAGSRAFAINGGSLVAGDLVVKGNLSHAALFKDGPIADLGTLPGGLYSRANGINSNEEVVGVSGGSYDADATRAFYWSATSGMVDLDTLGGAYAQATAINDTHFITGTAQLDGKMIGATHAFLMQAPTSHGYSTSMMDLGTLGGLSSYGLALNAKSHVVGYSLIALESDHFHAFLFDGQKMIDLGSLAPRTSGDFSVASSVNDNDFVVGYSYTLGTSAIDPTDAAPKQVAFLYTPQRGMVDLNDLIGDAAKEFHLFSASSINNKGQIAATGYDAKGNVHALLLAPPWELEKPARTAKAARGAK